jgi:arsenite methyltransferase
MGSSMGSGLATRSDNRRMALAGTVSADRRQLSRHLAKLHKVFAIDQIRSRALGAADVVEYYDQCFDAYRKYHSDEGAVHMALNDGGRFDPAGFKGQPRRIEATWPTEPSAVLELAYGHGYNLEDLARRHPQTRFHGIDLSPLHMRVTDHRLRAAGIGNVELAQGDFHELPYADSSFDHLWCIEAFCYATDTGRALREAARVLKPGGSFSLFDGYLPRPPRLLDTEEALAVELVAKGMAIAHLQVQDELLTHADQAGLHALEVTALDEQVMPSLRKLETLTGAVIRWPWLGRRALASRPHMRGRNVLAGYLMRTTVALGLIGYRHIVLRKEG